MCAPATCEQEADRQQSLKLHTKFKSFKLVAAQF